MWTESIQCDVLDLFAANPMDIVLTAALEFKRPACNPQCMDFVKHSIPMATKKIG